MPSKWRFRLRGSIGVPTRVGNTRLCSIHSSPASVRSVACRPRCSIKTRGELRGLPYGDHCRILEKMFPEWSAAQLFETISAEEAAKPIATRSKTSVDDHLNQSTNGRISLVTVGADLSNALIDVVRNSNECLVTVGSRSRA